jgi:DNA-3-methyladenine glycosylase II
MQPIAGFTDKNFISVCDALAIKDPDLRAIICQYGYPPLWRRTPTFETLVHII